MSTTTLLSKNELKQFEQDGYLVKRNFVDLGMITAIQNIVNEHLKDRTKPFELEHEVNYPGSPKSLKHKGGDTIRRLLLAHSRHDVFAQWQKSDNVSSVVAELLNAKQLYLVQSHHNCVMTKQPQFSSETHWHKDIRYWDFDNSNLINTWLPLGNETLENGCLQVIPGSNHWDTPTDRLDERLFLRKDLAKNQTWLDKSVDVELKQGDLLFFHAALFHAAGKNHTSISKNALVSTYHSEHNHELIELAGDMKPIVII